MRIIKLICIILLFSLPSGLCVYALSPSAESAILLTGDGQVIYEKNADKKMAFASTTKIMTALLAIEKLEYSATLSVASEAVGIEGSSVYLCAGESLTTEQLLYAVMLESANDAAAALACAVGGSVDGFVAMMNERAASLGLKSTNFDNPHGLFSENHYTTARDLSSLALYAMNNSVFKKIVSTQKTTIPMPGGDGVRLLSNHNRLLRQYPGAVGIKTGYTKKSGRCLVSAAERDGLLLICVTLNAPDDWRDHTAMLDFGFENYKSFSSVPFESVIPVVGGEKGEISVKTKECITVTLPKDSGEVVQITELPRFIFAPVSEGEAIGRLRYYCDGIEIGQTELVATEESKRTEYRFSLKEWIKDLFNG